MRSFLARDKKAFIDYVVIYAIIKVKHATANEVFNRGVKQIGVSLTLASIGIKYAANELSQTFINNYLT